MSTCYLLSQGQDSMPQTAEDGSFLGGVPKLPISEEIPHCSLCAAELTFFFQVELPFDQMWPGLTVATFACTSCADEEYLIPEMLKNRLYASKIPEHFLTAYQRNFRFLVFDTARASLRSTYSEKVSFRRFRLIASDDPTVPGSKIGGVPNWLLGDETPGTYAGSVPMAFLMQLQVGFRFETVKGAPRQIELGLDGKPRQANRQHYELFIGMQYTYLGPTILSYD